MNKHTETHLIRVDFQAHEIRDLVEMLGHTEQHHVDKAHDREEKAKQESDADRAQNFASLAAQSKADAEAAQAMRGALSQMHVE